MHSDSLYGPASKLECPMFRWCFESYWQLTQFSSKSEFVSYFMDFLAIFANFLPEYICCQTKLEAIMVVLRSFICNFLPDQFFVRPFCSDPNSAGMNYILKWNFLCRQFWPIDIFIVDKCEWYH